MKHPFLPTLLTIFSLPLLEACNDLPAETKPTEKKPLTVQSDSLKKHPDIQWILKILEYEAKQGSQWGTGLAYWGNYGKKPANLDAAVQYFIQDYLPRVSQYPPGLRERLGDYYYNTGRRPEDLLLFNAGIISLAQINSKQDLSSIWKKNSASLRSLFSDSVFVNRLDQSKDQVYQTTKPVNGQPHPAYLKTWKPRVWMWGTYSPGKLSR